MLDEIVEKTEQRVEKAKEIIPLDELKDEVSKLEINDGNTYIVFRSNDNGLSIK